MSAIKYICVMAIAWGTIATHALIFPAILGIFTLWTYCNVDKRKQPGASWIQDTFAALPFGGGTKSVPGWRTTQRERRRQICVVRGFWMPIVIGIPSLILALIFFLLVGINGLLLSLCGVVGYLGYRIAREPKNGWGGYEPSIR